MLPGSVGLVSSVPHLAGETEQPLCGGPQALYSTATLASESNSANCNIMASKQLRVGLIGGGEGTSSLSDGSGRYRYSTSLGYQWRK